MRKLLSCVLIALLIIAMGSGAYAQNAALGQTVLSTNVEIKYEISIPADASITYGTLSTGIGNIAVTKAQLEIGKQLVVTATTDNKLKNTADGSKTIAYVLKSGANTFTGASFTAVGTKPLAVEISQTAWDNAAAGSYSDTISFSVSYVPIP